MNKIKITICTGTLCHVLGGSELPAIIEYLPEKIRPFVEVIGSTCINHCKDDELKPPFAEINGELIGSATIEKLVTKILNLFPDDPQ